MADENIFSTALVNEIGSKALTLVRCEPLVTWVLENSHSVADNDAAAILLCDESRVKFYLHANRKIGAQYMAEFRKKVFDALNEQLQTQFREGDLVVNQCSESEQASLAAEALVSPASFQCFLLSVRRRVLGVFALSSANQGQFPLFRVNLFSRFAEETALAIDSLLAREQVVRQMRIIEGARINMETAFSGMGEGLVMLGDKDEAILINPTARRMLGIAAKVEDIPRSTLTGLFDPLLKELAKRERPAASCEIGRSDGEKRTYRADATLTRDSEGKKLATVILLRDITAEKEIDRMKSEFVSTVSHELRTPLTTIRESVSQVFDGILGPTTDQQREFLSMCLDDIDRLTRIINDLLDISKIEARKVQLRREVLDLVQLARGVSASFSGRFKEKGLELKISAPERAVVFCDRDKMIQVLTNLAGNSLKFTEHGYVEIAIKDTGAGVECSVYDTGRGIAEDDLPKVFSKFQQFGRTDGPGQQGTGLGLSIAKGIVELHNGRIWIESSLGAWTKFSIVLPRTVDAGAFSEIVSRKIDQSQRDGRKFCLVMVRMDGLPELDSAASQELAFAALAASVAIIRESDFTVLEGMKEFMLFSESKSAQELCALLEGGLEKHRFTAAGLEVQPKFAFGWAHWPVDARAAEELLSRARQKRSKEPQGEADG